MKGKWCGSCKEECDALVVDMGIGHYEFWGQRGHDSKECYVSDCCEGTVYDDFECTIEADIPDKFDEYDYEHR